MFEESFGHKHDFLRGDIFCGYPVVFRQLIKILTILSSCRRGIVDIISVYESGAPGSSPGA